jgi:acetyl esterase/lipase
MSVVALHPDFAPLAGALAAMTMDIGDLPAARRAFAEVIAANGFTPPSGLAIEDRAIVGADGGSLAVRLYRPASLPPAGAPAMLFCHGGSFALGDLDTENAKCADFATALPCLVVSVDYRLAPEHPHPAGLRDVLAAWRWLLAEAPALGVDPARVAVGGSSAGGCLAAAAAIALRGGGDDGVPPPAAQLLLCPPLDDAQEAPSLLAGTDAYIYTTAAAAHMWRYYLGAGHVPGTAPSTAAPARAADLRGLPPTFLGVGGPDPLRDEGLDYARRLVDAGVPVDLLHVAGAPHGFDALAGIPVADRARAAAQAALRDVLHAPLTSEQQTT